MCAPVQDVCRGLGLDLRGQTSASFNMRQNYERCLFKFEDYLSSGAYIADLNAGAQRFRGFKSACFMSASLCQPPPHPTGRRPLERLQSYCRMLYRPCKHCIPLPL
jgi:hypothetical protein